MRGWLTVFWSLLLLSLIQLFNYCLFYLCLSQSLILSFLSLSSGGRLSPVSGHCGSESGAHGNPSGEGKPDQTSQVYDPNGSVLGALPCPPVDGDRVLPVWTHLPTHLGENMDGGELQALSHPLSIQGRETERGERMCLWCNVAIFARQSMRHLLIIIIIII